MRIHADGYSFEAPPGLVDWTNYAFRNDDDTEVVTVTTGELPEGVTDLPSLLKDRMADLESALGPALRIGAEADGAIGSIPARLVTFAVTDGEARFVERWAVALDGEGRYLQVSHAVRGNVEGSGDRFNRLLASAGPSDAPPGAGPDGTVRRAAAGRSFLLAADLRPPTTWQWASDDETIDVAVATHAADTEPSLEEEAAGDERFGRVEGAAAAGLPEALQPGESVTYLIDGETPDGERVDWCRRMVLPRGAVRIHLAGRGPEPRRAEVDSLLLVLAKSIRTER